MRSLQKRGFCKILRFMSEIKKKSFWKGNVMVAAFFGAFCSLAFAPVHFFIAAPIAISFFYSLLERTENKKEVFWIGFAFGFGHFLTGIYWIAISLLVDAANFAWLIPFALTLIPAALALYLALFAVTFKFLVRKFKFTFTYQKILVFALCWVAFEILRSLLFTGFPWNLLGYIWMVDIHLAQLASVFGIYGLSLFAVLVSLLPAFFFRKKYRASNPDRIFIAMLIALLISNAIYGYLRVDVNELNTRPEVKLRLVQGNILQEMKWDEEEKYQNLLKHIELTNSQSMDNVTAVIWSETAVPYVIDENPDLLAKLKEATPKKGSLITGGLRVGYLGNQEQIISAWNSIFLLDREGVKAVYDKHHLVPFGEYIPLQKYLPFISKITQGAIGFNEGDGAKTLVARGFSFSPLICYEVIFSDEILNKESRPDLLVNLTNDAWFGNSSGPYQHFEMSKMRSIEYGIPMARVANTGITAFIDPFGQVIDKINLNQFGIIDVNLIEKLAPTIYGKYRYAPLILLVAAILLSLIILPKRHHVTRQDHTS